MADPSPPRQGRRLLLLLLLAFDRVGLTLRGFWTMAVAVASVLVAAATSYFALFPNPKGGAPLGLALVAGILGIPCLVAGLCGVRAVRHRPCTTRNR